jgi:D5 N terminal like
MPADRGAGRRVECLIVSRDQERGRGRRLRLPSRVDRPRAGVAAAASLCPALAPGTQVKGRLIHVTGRGWLAWDVARWREDQKAAERASKKLAADVILQALEREDKEMHKKALGRSAESKIRATLKLAESDVRLSVEPARLDADPELLNTPSGVVDLREGKLYQHDPDLLMTKLAGAVYDPNACSERWLCFLEEATGGDDELTAWLQRFAGYAATGHATEEVVAFLYGPGATGKTTWGEAVRAARGSYAATAEFASFLAGRSDGSAASPDIARLVGVRAAFASEVNLGQRFNPQRLKSLTGGETITARRLYRDPSSSGPSSRLFSPPTSGQRSPPTTAPPGAGYASFRSTTWCRPTRAARRSRTSSSTTTTSEQACLPGSSKAQSTGTAMGSARAGPSTAPQRAIRRTSVRSRRPLGRPRGRAEPGPFPRIGLRPAGPQQICATTVPVPAWLGSGA